jgi:hypothetical protein
MNHHNQSDIICQRLQSIHSELKKIRAAKLCKGQKMWSVTDRNKEHYESQLMISLQEYQKLLDLSFQPTK